MGYGMGRFVAVIVVLLAGASFCRAQESSGPCKTYFVIYQFDPNLTFLRMPLLTTDQSKWLEKEAKKKYPHFCFDAGKATYVMASIRWTEEMRQTVTKTKSAYTTGPVPAVVGLSASGPGRPAQPIWGTQLATFVTTWQERETEVVHKPRALILTFETKDSKALSEAIELKPQPVAQVKGVGKKASRDALRQTFEILDLIREAHADEVK